MNEHLRTSKAGIDLISKWESCALQEYICPAGKPTIGIGHVVLPSEKFPPKITREFAEQLLAKDLVRFEKGVYRNIKVALTQHQFDALVSFTFNVGEGGLVNTNVQRAVNEGRFKDVPAALEAWSKARVKGQMVTLQGLLNRRKSEGALFLLPDTVPSQAPSEMVAWTRDGLKDVQTKLKVMGLYTASVDGVWGPATAKALSLFATQKNLALGSSSDKSVPRTLLDALV